MTVSNVNSYSLQLHHLVDIDNGRLLAVALLGSESYNNYCVYDYFFAF